MKYIEECKMVDFNDCPLSKKNGFYGGQAGSKDGIIYKGEDWILKYPKNLKEMKEASARNQKNLRSYSTAPLSEYLGSKVYEILGYDVHKVLLGEKRDKIVVACKDFTDLNTRLFELRTIKNHENEALSIMLDDIVKSTGSSHFVDLPTLLLHLEHNEILNNIQGVNERFWEQAVVDVFINNNDRNNGNWGIIRDAITGEDRLAPVYDNGGSFLNKASDETIKRQLDNIKQTRINASNTQTIYAMGGHILSTKAFLDLHKEYSALEEAIFKVVPLIQEKMNEIKDMINAVPNSYTTRTGQTLSVMSEEMKRLFIFQLEARMEDLLKPVYYEIANNRIVEQDKDSQKDILKKE